MYQNSDSTNLGKPMATLGENLKKIRKAKKMTQKEVAQRSGVKQSVISDLETGTAKSTGSILELASALGVTAEELKKGVSDGASLGDSGFSNVRLIDGDLRRIPVLDFVQAGIFHESGYDGINPKGETYTTYVGCKPESVFSLEVSGLSMTPDFSPGDQLVIDAAKEPYPGCYVIAQNGSHEATFKKYRAVGYDEHGRETFELVPLNPDFPTMDSTKQEIRIIGVVVQHSRRFGK